MNVFVTKAKSNMLAHMHEASHSDSLVRQASERSIDLTCHYGSRIIYSLVYTRLQNATDWNPRQSFGYSLVVGREGCALANSASYGLTTISASWPSEISCPALSAGSVGKVLSSGNLMFSSA